MNCVKMGAIFKPDGNYDWMHYYGCPLAAIEMESCIRVYFSTRSKLDEKGHFKTHITFLDCDKNNPGKVLYVHNKPLLDMGLPGTFDEHGTMIANVLFHNNQYYMYYIGWQRTDNAPYVNCIGLAISDDGENFKRVSDGPVMGCNRFVPYGIGNVYILIEDGVFHMWYTHYNAWLKSGKGFRPTYDIRYGSSANGLDWEFNNHICVGPSRDNEAIAAPCIRNINGKYRMWYSFREGLDTNGNSGQYKIGYAYSDNRLDWTRADAEVGIGLSESGWDSEMMLGPEVLETKDNIFMFYAGNFYGREGFGYAKVENI